MNAAVEEYQKHAESFAAEPSSRCSVDVAPGDQIASMLALPDGKLSTTSTSEGAEIVTKSQSL